MRGIATRPCMHRNEVIDYFSYGINRGVLTDNLSQGLLKPYPVNHFPFLLTGYIRAECKADKDCFSIFAPGAPGCYGMFSFPVLISKTSEAFDNLTVSGHEKKVGGKISYDEVTESLPVLLP